MAVWYPTADPETRHNYSREITGSVAPDGSLASCGRFPLVVFSHGFGGCGTQSIFFTQELARKGYVVAAPDHNDALCSVEGKGRLLLRPSQKPFFKPRLWNEDTYSDRRSDLDRMMDWLLKDSEFAGIIDAARIGAAGHSLGGYTVLGMAGGWSEWKDPRIKAVLLFSPYALPFVVKNRLRSVDVPVMYQGAQLDIGITPFIRGKEGAYNLVDAPKVYVELKGGTHFEWTNMLCLGNKLISDCLEKKRNARLIIQHGAGFFDRYLKQESEAIERLDKSGLAAYERGSAAEAK